MSATSPLDLRTGSPVWTTRPAPRVTHAALSRDLSCDVLIIGAGISGAKIAETLAEAGLDVGIVDRRGPVKGSTAASTSLLQYELDTPLSILSKRIGVTRAERMWRRSRLAEALGQRARRLGIVADLIDRDSLYLEGDRLDEAGLLTECTARQRAGFETVFLDRQAVKSVLGSAGARRS